VSSVPLSSSPERSFDRSGHRSGSLPLVLLLAGSLVGASLWRGYTVKTFGPQRASSTGNSASVSQFNSYTLGLLLGGLRGPLVMTLWSSSETQKGERNLDDINTKIELIGLLQPEFDAVHLFQIWNKAYNLSVQMSNLPTKYATILDALDYADNRRRDTVTPNLNLESSVASIYFDKLGGSNEKAYYRARVREESRAPVGQTKFVFPESRREEFIRAALAAGADARRYSIRPESGQSGKLSARLSDEYATRVASSFSGPDVETTRFAPRDPARAARTALRGALDPILDADGRILGSLARHDLTVAIDDAQWHPEYGELQYLVRFEPFRYGVSPFALGYNYYKRSLALQESRGQKHAQLSDRVISSRPGLALKSWAEEEIELARQAEMAQFGLRPLSEEESALPMELPATLIPVDRIPSTPLLEEAIYSYQRAADLGALSLTEFRSHAQRYPDDQGNYRSQIADILAKAALARGDGLFLQAITADSDAKRADFAREAAAAYRDAVNLFERNILSYFVPDEIIPTVFPKGYGKIDAINSFENPAAFPLDQVGPTLNRALSAMTAMNVPLSSEIAEYQTYATRAQARLNRLAPLLNR
jgi:hypothetical protein